MGENGSDSDSLVLVGDIFCHRQGHWAWQELSASSRAQGRNIQVPEGDAIASDRQLIVYCQEQGGLCKRTLTPSPMELMNRCKHYLAQISCY